MKYEFVSRVRYSELGRDGVLSLPSILNFFQDCSTFQSEDLGVGLSYLEEKKKAWILYSWQVEIERDLHLGEKITVGTFASDFNGIYGKRNFFLQDENKMMVAKANSLWVYMDLDSQRPTRPTEEEIAIYGKEEPLEMENLSRKIQIPEEYEVRQPIVVRHDQIDTNNHVNNVQYVQMALEAMPSSSFVSKLRVEYKKAAVFGDVIIPRVAKNEDGYVVALCDEAGSLFATVASTMGGKNEIRLCARARSSEAGRFRCVFRNRG